MFSAPTGTLVSQDLGLAWLWTSPIAAGKPDPLSETSTSVLSQQKIVEKRRVFLYLSSRPPIPLQSGEGRCHFVIVPQTVLALRGSDGFSRDLCRCAGVRPRSSRARSCCKNRYLVTLTFAPLERNRGSRAQTHKNSTLFDNLLLRQDRCLSSSHLSCLNSRHLSCLNRRHLSCLNRRHLSCLNSRHLQHLRLPGHHVAA